MKTSDELFHPTEEHRLLRQAVIDFARKEVEPQAAEFDRRGVLNVPLFRKLGELGWLGITIPVEDGGAGMDAVASVIIHHELAKYDPGFALAYLAHSILFVHNFYHCSTPEQRKRYLPKTLSGEWIAGMGMTEPNAGTDVLAMQTTAHKEGDYWVLRGSKTYITNGCEGYCFLVYAKVDGKITAFVVDRSCHGFSTSQHIEKMGMRSSTMAELIFDNCRVPESNLLGEVGGGLTHMMRNLEIERVTLAAISVGIAERCVEIMVRYANERHTFGKPIAEHGQIQRYIAEAYAAKEAAKALVYSVAHDIRPDRRNRIASDAAKLFAAPVGKMCADYAMQVMGGAGYCSEYPVERFYRDAKLLEIGGGTLEAHHKNITKDLSKALK
ncbi:MAG: acyl-CoA dehydrogenase family protein [Sandaracinaceae bacterium]|nr:acyl-CoA dehydrogenase family protein [Sandaracinaceae bacterium]MDW8245395.1 acyl-CoA dehydrogenase family protein [Sandaracinaceae bacterium]